MLVNLLVHGSKTPCRGMKEKGGESLYRWAFEEKKEFL